MTPELFYYFILGPCTIISILLATGIFYKIADKVMYPIDRRYIRKLKGDAWRKATLERWDRIIDRLSSPR